MPLTVSTTADLYSTNLPMSLQVDVDSRASTPGLVRKAVQLELGFAEMKRALAPPTTREKENAENARKELLEKYKTASFGELCQMTIDSRPKETLYQCLTDIYSKVRPFLLLSH